MLLRFINTLILSSVFTATGSQAVDIGDNLHVSGFVAAGQSYSDEKQRDVADDRWQNLYEGGLKASWTLPANFEINAQLLYRDYDSMAEGDNFWLDYATLDWHYNGSQFGEQVISLGRFKSNGGVYSSTRDVPFTRPSILLAQSVYPEELRGLFLNTDGIRLASTHLVGNGDLTVEIGYGTTEIDDSFERVTVGDVHFGEWEANNSHFFDLRYHNPHWLLSYTYSDISPEFNGIAPPQLVKDLGLGSKELHSLMEFASHTFGIQYQKESWELTAEFVRRDIDFSSRNNSGNSGAQHSTGYYGQARYFLTHDIAVVARWEEFRLNSSPTAYEESIDESFGLRDTSTKVVGLSWQFAANWQVSAELQRIDIDRHGKQQQVDKNLGLAQIAWRF